MNHRATMTATATRPDIERGAMTLKRRRRSSRASSSRCRPSRSWSASSAFRSARRSTTPSRSGTDSPRPGSAPPPGPRRFTTPICGRPSRTTRLLLLAVPFALATPPRHRGLAAPARRGLADLPLHLLLPDRDLLGRPRTRRRTILRLPGDAELDHPRVRAFRTSTPTCWATNRRPSSRSASPSSSP